MVFFIAIFSRLITVTHGDFWSNNMMFHHDGETGEPRSLKIIDFQMMGRGHPAVDICYLLHVNTDSEFRGEFHKTVLPRFVDEFLKEYLSTSERYCLSQMLIQPTQNKKVAVVSCYIFCTIWL